MEYIVHYDRYRKQIVSNLEAAYKFIAQYISSNHLSCSPLSKMRNAKKDVEVVTYLYPTNSVETFTIIKQPTQDCYEEILANAMSKNASIVDKMTLYRWCLHNMGEDVEYDEYKNSFYIKKSNIVVNLFSRVSQMSGEDLINRFQDLQHEHGTLNFDDLMEIDAEYLFQIVDLDIKTKQ